MRRGRLGRRLGSGAGIPVARAWLVAAGLILAGPAAAQDWFRPPGNVGSPGQAARPAAPSRSQQRQEPSRAAPPAQARPQQVWNPFSPLLDLFRAPAQRQRSNPFWQNNAPPSAEVKPRRQAPVDAEPRGTVFESAEAARKASEKPLTDLVMVLGDEFAGSLAQGLADAFAADRPDAAVIADTRSGSGLAPDGEFDWVSGAPRAVAAENPTALVLLMGSNDLHPIKTETGVAEVLDERWKEIYARRLDDLLAALRGRGRPVLVVGLPPVGDSRASEGNADLNEIIKARTEQVGLIYADVWDGFVDENGKFLTFGPAVDGQRRRLRNSDGVGFTRAGARKLAFFVDRALGKLLSGGNAATAAAVPSVSGIPNIIQLTGAGAGATAGAAQVLEGGDEPRPTKISVGESVAARVLIAGEPLPAVIGRVDDFRWPRNGQVPPEPAGDAGVATGTEAAAGAQAGMGDAGTATP